MSYAKIFEHFGGMFCILVEKQGDLQRKNPAYGTILRGIYLQAPFCVLGVSFGVGVGWGGTWGVFNHYSTGNKNSQLQFYIVNVRSS